MNSKQKYGIIIAVIAVIGTAAGGSFVIDQSTTIIGQIGDNVINQYFADQGINLEEFKRMCDAGEVDEEFVKYCRLI